MRIHRLKLVRYGHFEGEILEFPKSEHDIHVVYGDNEAGKSIVLNALGDVLFGIPERTTLGYRFQMSSLQVGATLMSGKETFEFVRRKGRGDTIVDEDGNKIVDGEKTLKEILNGGDREFFERMFLLDNHRLVTGSQALLAGSDAGESILATSAGLEGLHDLVQSLQEESDALWAPTKSMKREFYKAKGLLDTATNTMREVLVDTRQWKKAQRVKTDAQAAYEALQASIRTKRAERARLDRIRRLHSSIKKLGTAYEELSALNKPKILPEQAKETLDTALTERKLLLGKIEQHDERINELETAIDGLKIDKQILAIAEDVGQLDEKRIQLKEHRAALPRREEKRDQLKISANNLAKEAGWEVADYAHIKEMLPSRPAVDRARGLATQYTELTTERRGFHRDHNKAEDERKRIKKEVSKLPRSVDLTALRAAVVAAQADKDLIQARDRAKEQVAVADVKLKTSLASLAPAIDDDTKVSSAIVPSRESISRHRDEYNELDKQLGEAKGRRRSLNRQVEEVAADIRSKQDAIDAMSEEDLLGARENRDSAWDLISARYIHGKNCSPEQWRELFDNDEVGDQRYQVLVAIADEGADTRFANARDVGEIVSLENTLTRLKNESSALAEDIDASENRIIVLNDRWQKYWKDSPVTPSIPDLGLPWLDQFVACRDQSQKCNEFSVHLEEAQQRLINACQTLINVLKGVADDEITTEEEDLAGLIALATEVGGAIRQRNDDSDAKRKSLEEADHALTEARSDLATKDAEIEAWQISWKIVLEELNLDLATTPDALESHLGLIDELRDRTRQIDELQTERIDKIRRDIEQFEAAVTELVKSLKLDKPGEDPNTVVKILVSQLEQSLSDQDKKTQAESSILETRAKIEALVDEKQVFEDTIARLAELATVDNEQELRTAAIASDRRRELEADIEELTDTIESNGDERTLDELRNESTDVDLDTAVATLQELEEELEVVDADFLLKRDAFLAAERALDEIGVEGEAAVAESGRQQALAEIEQISERFVRTSTASALLQWSIDRFRTKNQKPLLDRASILFRLLTRGSFDRVAVEYDGDTPVLAGRRPSGEVTSAKDMSSGARDQLFLALRLAAIEEYVGKSSAMPFVGDDLFIHHDKTRTREALGALVELSKTCQVILFSHDEAFVDLAKDVLPPGSNVLNLEAPLDSLME